MKDQILGLPARGPAGELIRMMDSPRKSASRSNQVDSRAPIPVPVEPADESRHDRTRRLIIEAAAECFERLSLRYTSMEEVARAARLSRPTIYRHFEGKEELIAAVSEKKARDVTGLVEARIGRKKGPYSKIVTAIVTCVECLVTDRQMREMVNGEYKELMLRAQSPGIVAISTERWLPILREARASGVIAQDVNYPRLISWITDLEILLAMRVIAFGTGLDEIRSDVETFMINGIRCAS